MTDSLTTGFAPLPWDIFTANNGQYDGLPQVAADHDGPCCPAVWRSPADDPGEQPWLCTLPVDHTGSHRASDPVQILAEWA